MAERGERQDRTFLPEDKDSDKIARLSAGSRSRRGPGPLLLVAAWPSCAAGVIGRHGIDGALIGPQQGRGGALDAARRYACGGPREAAAAAVEWSRHLLTIPPRPC